MVFHQGIKVEAGHPQGRRPQMRLDRLDRLDQDQADQADEDQADQDQADQVDRDRSPQVGGQAPRDRRLPRRSGSHRLRGRQVRREQ